MKNKYRLFLITQVDQERSAQHEAAKLEMQGLIDIGVVKSHRVMYCSTSEGKKAIVRQFSAEMHIDTDVEIIQALHRYMNKFHLIKTPANKEEATRLAKEQADKIVTFRSADAYASKLLQTMGAQPSLQRSLSQVSGTTVQLRQ